MGASALPPVVAVVAEDKVCHRLVSSVDLVLHVPSGLASAGLAREEARELTSVLQGDLVLEVGAAALHDLVAGLFALLKKFLAGQLAGVGQDHLSNAQFLVEDPLLEVGVARVAHVEQERSSSL